jgi:hypothetical protein
VTRVYVRDSLLINMAADDKREGGAGCARTDQVGKVFIAVGQRVRKCLVCEELFTRRASAEHAKVICYPTVSDVRHMGRPNEHR